MNIYIYVNIYICKYIYVCIYIYISIYVNIYIYKYTYVGRNVYTSIFICLVYMYIYIYPSKLPRRQPIFDLWAINKTWGHRRTLVPSRIYIYIHTYYILLHTYVYIYIHITIYIYKYIYIYIRRLYQDVNVYAHVGIWKGQNKVDWTNPCIGLQHFEFWVDDVQIKSGSCSMVTHLDK